MGARKPSSAARRRSDEARWKLCFSFMMLDTDSMDAFPPVSGRSRSSELRASSGVRVSRSRLNFSKDAN